MGATDRRPDVFLNAIRKSIINLDFFINSRGAGGRAEHTPSSPPLPFPWVGKEGSGS